MGGSPGARAGCKRRDPCRCSALVGQGWPTSAVPELAPWARVGHQLHGPPYPEVPIPWAPGGHGMVSFVLSASVPPLARSKWSLLLTSLGYKKVSRRKPLIHSAVSGQPSRASGLWGRLCLASVTSRAGRQQQGLAASCKPLIFPQLTIIRAALESKRSGRCRRRARGCRAASRTLPSYCLTCVRSCSLLCVTEPGTAGSWEVKWEGRAAWGHGL